MTPQEAEKLADRLRRVWGCNVTWKPDGFFVIFLEDTIRPTPLLHVRSMDGKIICCRHLDFQRTALQWTPECVIGPALSHGTDDRKSKALGVVPAFLTKCFLSGAPIECTAHERADWAREAYEAGTLTADECRALLAPQEALCQSN